jgi:hypothetical protein
MPAGRQRPVTASFTNKCLPHSVTFLGLQLMVE